MRRRNIVLSAGGLLLAFGAGWFVRGLEPELSCKERGGFYSEAVRTCIYVEPTTASLNQAEAEASKHFGKRH